MLGRLFKLKSLLSLGGSTTSKVAGELSDGTANPTPTTQTPNDANVNAVSFEDSYTREILYGSLELALHPLLFNPKRFRLLVSQDGGDLRAKQVLYDSSKYLVEGVSLRTKSSPATVSPSAESFSDPGSSRLGSSSNSRLPNSANTLRSGSSYNKVPIAKQTHNINDLNDYMFGRGIPSVERHTSTKIHVLLPLSLLGDGSGMAVLLSRVFLISAVGYNADSELTGDLDWVPRPTFKSKDSVLQIHVPTAKHHCGSSDHSQLQNRAFSFSSRFAVGVVIPLEDSGETIEEVISSNWETIAHFLIVLQKLICKKLTLALKASLINGLSPLISNKRIVFPLGVLQLEPEFGHQLQKLTKLIHYNVNTPRLININAFMTHSLNHMSTNLNTNVINWALEVINWLEFKDGRNFSPFHTQGLAVPQMHSQHSYLLQSASGASPWYRSHETPASSNTFLASLFALILPMRHMLAKGPLHVDAENRDGSKAITRIVVMTSNSSVAKKLLFILSGLIPDVEFLHRLENAGDVDANSSGTLSETPTPGANVEPNSKLSPLTCLQSKIANSPKGNGISFTAKPTTSQPIPIRSDRVGSNPQSDDSALASVSSTKGWDVPHKSATSLSLHGQTTTSEVANVTAAQQIPGPRRVSASNSSSMAHLSSSLNSSLSSNASNYSLSRLGSSFMDKWKNSLVGSNKFHQNFISETIDGAFTSDNINARPSMYSVSSPSPADELDEPVWEGSFSASTGSPMKQKCSRTQSLLNLSGEATNKTAGVSSSALGVDRTRTSVIFPPLRDKNLNVDDVNSSIIKQKVWSLMRCDLKLSTRGRKGLKADYLNEKYPSEESNRLDQSGTLYVQISSIMSPQLHKKAYLQPNVAFVDEFRPEYTIQSCPVNPRLEAQVSNAMKNDLLFYQNNCGYEKITSKTVYIGLRAREIKLIEMSVESPKRGKGYTSSVSPAAVVDLRQSYFSSAPSESPISSYFHGGDYSNHEKREIPAANTFRTTVKKVFSPNKNSGDRDAINYVEAQLEKLNEVASLINSNSAETVETKDLYNRMLCNAVRELIT